jgi:ketosteroid isomerase-like protein
LAQLEAAIRAKDDAYRSGRIEEYLAAFAPDATVFFAGRLMDLEGWRRFLGSFFDTGGRMLSFSSETPDHILLNDRGDAATVDYPWSESFLYADGRKINARYHESNVWFRRNGAWRIVQYHLSTVSETAEE